jgi:hypothetical protein
MSTLRGNETRGGAHECDDAARPFDHPEDLLCLHHPSIGAALELRTHFQTPRKKLDDSREAARGHGGEITGIVSSWADELRLLVNTRSSRGQWVEDRNKARLTHRERLTPSAT